MINYDIYFNLKTQLKFTFIRNDQKFYEIFIKKVMKHYNICMKSHMNV